MPADVGYSFMGNDLNNVVNELIDMEKLPRDAQSRERVMQAIMANPALGANTPTGEAIAAATTDPFFSTLSERDFFVDSLYEAPGAKEALEAFRSANATPTSGDVTNGTDNRVRSDSSAPSVRGMATPAQTAEASRAGGTQGDVREGNQGGQAAGEGNQGQGQPGQVNGIGIDDLLIPLLLGGAIGGANAAFNPRAPAQPDVQGDTKQPPGPDRKLLPAPGEPLPVEPSRPPELPPMVSQERQRQMRRPISPVVDDTVSSRAMTTRAPTNVAPVDPAVQPLEGDIIPGGQPAIEGEVLRHPNGGEFRVVGAAQNGEWLLEDLRTGRQVVVPQQALNRLTRQPGTNVVPRAASAVARSVR